MPLKRSAICGLTLRDGGQLAGNGGGVCLACRDRLDASERGVGFGETPLGSPASAGDLRQDHAQRKGEDAGTPPITNNHCQPRWGTTHTPVSATKNSAIENSTWIETEKGRSAALANSLI